MSIKTTKNELKETIRKVYIDILKEEDQAVDARMLNKVSFGVAEQLVHLVKKQAMENGLPPEKLLAAVMDQAKLQMKE